MRPWNPPLYFLIWKRDLYGALNAICDVFFNRLFIRHAIFILIHLHTRRLDRQLQPATVLSVLCVGKEEEKTSANFSFKISFMKRGISWTSCPIRGYKLVLFLLDKHLPACLPLPPLSLISLVTSFEDRIRPWLCCDSRPILSLYFVRDYWWHRVYPRCNVTALARGPSSVNMYHGWCAS